jgi:Rap1a immunity proteins
MTVSALAIAAIPMKAATANANRVAARMREPPATVVKASLPRGRQVVSTERPISRAGWPNSTRKRYGVFAVVFAAIVLSAPSHADPPDISARRLLSSWQEGDPGMKMLAEVIASAFASGFSWGGNAAGKHPYCAPADLKGGQIMSAFEAFLRDHPQLSGEPYGAAMAATVTQTFPCSGQ